MEFYSNSNCPIECRLMLIQDWAQKEQIEIKHIPTLSRSDDVIEEGNIIKLNYGYIGIFHMDPKLPEFIVVYFCFKWFDFPKINPEQW